MTARPSCLRLFVHWIRRAASRADCTAGSSNEIRTAMIAMTTRSSIRVKPRRMHVDSLGRRTIFILLDAARRGKDDGLNHMLEPIANAAHVWLAADSGSSDGRPRRSEPGLGRMHPPE